MNDDNVIIPYEYNKQHKTSIEIIVLTDKRLSDSAIRLFSYIKSVINISYAKNKIDYTELTYKEIEEYIGFNEHKTAKRIKELLKYKYIKIKKVKGNRGLKKNRYYITAIFDSNNNKSLQNITVNLDNELKGDNRDITVISESNNSNITAKNDSDLKNITVKFDSFNTVKFDSNISSEIISDKVDPKSSKLDKHVYNNNNNSSSTICTVHDKYVVVVDDSDKKRKEYKIKHNHLYSILQYCIKNNIKLSKEKIDDIGKIYDYYIEQSYKKNGKKLKITAYIKHRKLKAYKSINYHKKVQKSNQNLPQIQFEIGDTLQKNIDVLSSNLKNGYKQFLIKFSIAISEYKKQNEIDYNTWIKKFCIEKVEHNSITIRAPNNFSFERYNTRFKKTLDEFVKKECGEEFKVFCIV